MMDFAQVKLINQDTTITKERVESRSITLNPISLSASLIITLILYLIGYQNMTISQTKHKINQQKAIINSLILQKQELLKSKQMLLNPKSILSQTNNVDNDILIIH